MHHLFKQIQTLSADGSGLNDLLKSPWMMIHPPVLFIGFAMMTIPYCFAMAALWKRKYNEWVGPALPWTLGANLSLLTAIFLRAIGPISHLALVDIGLGIL